MRSSNPKSRHLLSKLFFVLVGHISLGLGIVGIALPLLPTTPFLLLAAACYMRGSDHLYNWLLNQRLLGAYITHYQEGRGLPLKLRITLIALLWVTISASAFYFIEKPYVTLILFVVAVLVSAFIWTKSAQE
jgi:uncharacterized membrane protein YbaN (DUF454 family)